MTPGTAMFLPHVFPKKYKGKVVRNCLGNPDLLRSKPVFGTTSVPKGVT